MTRGTGLLAALVRNYGDERCTCPHEIQGLGLLYGISLGRGWVRLDDDPDCPHHGRHGDVRVVCCWCRIAYGRGRYGNLVHPKPACR